MDAPAKRREANGPKSFIGDDRPSDEDWRHAAACRHHDPETWYPIGDTGPALLQIDDAKKICFTCPSMRQCGDWALETNQQFGVWGGMSESDRRAVKRRAARARARELGLPEPEDEPEAPGRNKVRGGHGRFGSPLDSPAGSAGDAA